MGNVQLLNTCRFSTAHVYLNNRNHTFAKISLVYTVLSRKNQDGNTIGVSGYSNGPNQLSALTYTLITAISKCSGVKLPQAFGGPSIWILVSYIPVGG